MGPVSEEADLAQANSHIELATTRLLAQADRVRRLELAGCDSTEASRFLEIMRDSLVSMHMHRRVIKHELGQDDVEDDPEAASAS